MQKMSTPRSRHPRQLLIWILVMSLASGVLPLQACAAPSEPPPPPPSQKKKPSSPGQEQRIEMLEKQLEQQNQLLRQMQKQLEEMRRQQSVPTQTSTPALAPAGLPVPAASPSPDSPMIDDSVPPAPGESPKSPDAPASPTVPAVSAPGPAASPSPGGPLIDDSVPPGPGAPTTPSAPSQAPHGILGGGGSNALNPDISAIGLFEVRTSSDKSNRLDNQPSVREVELALQAPIDPFARYDIFLTIPSGGSLSLEEGYATFLTLPAGFQAKMGLIKSPFGRNNQLHTHAFPQIDRPQVIQQFFGEEGLAGPGVLLSNVLPLPWYSEFVVQGMANDNDTLFSGGTSQKPIWVANWRNLIDLREDLTAELGLSGAYGSNCTPTNQDTRVVGASLTFKYKPLRTLGSWSLAWETEYLTEMQRVPVMVQANPDVPPQQQMTHQSANGLYSYVEFQPNRNWFFDARYDWTHLPNDPSKVMSGWTGLVGYRFSEFNSVRLQYSQYKRNWDNALRQLFFQWNVVIGPHGAHKY